jgi:hypothetical protein
MRFGGTDMKHTPGPWYYDGISVKARGGYCVAYTNDIKAEPYNARLIAAAPKLLEALKKADSLLRWGNGGLLNGSETHKAVREALAEAGYEGLE